MYLDKKIWIGQSVDNEQIYIRPKMANRHGLIAGATGTGKTTTLRVMAESFSDCGVPVFLADIKGDVAAMCKPGDGAGFVADRVADYDLDQYGFRLHACPVTFWDVYGEQGLPLRTTISEMGPLLLSRILGLNATQEGILTVVFKIADDQGLLLIDTKDLRAMLQYVSEHAKEYASTYGNMSTQSLAVIIRAVIALESEGGEIFFGEPAIKISDWIGRNEDGKGIVNILDCQKLINNPNMYSTFMLWLLSELYETLPEVGDMEKPRIVFFFDEAHLLFNNASKALLEKIEQVVKLIRSKGVGIYFITQSPKDVPDGVLAQLSNKVQHALRAYTPAEQKNIKAAAQSFRINPNFDTVETLQNLGIGQAIVSVLDEHGTPTITEKCVILPPQSGMGTISESERETLNKQNDLYLKYTDYFDRDSAYEFLQRKAASDSEESERAAQEAASAKEAAAAEKKAAASEKKSSKSSSEKSTKSNDKVKKAATKVAKGVATTTGGTLGRELGKSVGTSIGGTFGKKLGGNIGASLGRGLLGSLFGK